MSMTAVREQSPFITYLYRVHESGDRGALSTLRRSVGKPPGTDTATYPLVLPFLPKGVSGRSPAAAPYFVIAGLFASFAKSTHAVEGPSLGTSLRAIRANPSSELRMRALINAHADELQWHLRQMLSLLAAKSGSVDWQQLLKDISWWEAPDRWVQLKWAADYWAPMDDE